MGFVIFMVIGAYLLISFGVMAWAISYAKKSGKGAIRWGMGAALVMFLIPCWDWIPTVVVHKYYCEKEAGFWVYKTLEQWKVENPGVMETLVENPISIKHVGNGNDFTDTIELNQRFAHVHRFKGPLKFNLWRIETEIRDIKNGEVIAREIDFSTSQERRRAGWSGWKFWLDSERCSVESHRDNGSFGKITTQFGGAIK
ncbi:MAG: hypothetical protein PHI11_11150 [Gallionella sp.]|nr:hypothetical protein [Gallionella sp.]